jgi:hypothetical protein
VDDDEIVETLLPHSEFGDEDCCGCFIGVVKGDLATIECNECLAVIKTVPVSDLRRTFDEMELTLDVASEICPKCGAANLFPRFSKILAYTCRECGKGVKTEND